MIIDDVTEARITLRQDIEQYCPELVIVGEADGVASGIEAIRLNAPMSFSWTLKWATVRGSTCSSVLVRRRSR